MRIFYAFTLPEEVADWLYKTSLALREKLAGGKVTPKENLHITAAFVGNVNEIKTDILSQILREVAANNTASTLSTCPPTRLRGADLICSKIKADDALFKINSDLTRLLAQKGFNVEKRFTPHVTLIRRPGFKPSFAELKNQADFQSVSFTADKISLLESKTDSAFPRYITLKTEKLVSPSSK